MNQLPDCKLKEQMCSLGHFPIFSKLMRHFTKTVYRGFLNGQHNVKICLT